ncbi:MAG: EF-P lysine aminoacylase EpmA [Gammaproteobacteria bacterium]
MSESWRPIAGNQLIKLRADTYTRIRQFMAEREVLEVETPVLSHATVTDTQLDSFNCEYSSPQTTLDKTLYLQTSPEYAMKRLLASGTGAIYQISKVFRNEEQGKYHNPEFTMLEWYQPGFDHHQLMAELVSFLSLFAMSNCEKTSYADIFARQTGLDPHTCDTNELVSLAEGYGLSSSSEERSVLLDFIFSHKIASTLGNTNPLFVYDYPACLSALAKLSDKSPKVAERFELFINGMEIANGFHELTNADEQLGRFKEDLALRNKAKRPTLPIDHLFMDALKQGLPDCAGVAVGIDRLLMAITGVKDIREVLTFPIENA